MRNKLLLSTAALVTCVTLASAQNMPGGQSGGGAERGQSQSQGRGDAQRGRRRIASRAAGHLRVSDDWPISAACAGR